MRQIITKELEIILFHLIYLKSPQSLWPAMSSVDGTEPLNLF